MACRLDGAKPLFEPMLEYCKLDPRNKLQWNFNRNSNISLKKMHLTMSSAKRRPFSLGFNVSISFWIWYTNIKRCSQGLSVMALNLCHGISLSVTINQPWRPACMKNVWHSGYPCVMERDGPFQHQIKYHIVRSQKVSNPRDWMLVCSHCFEIWQAIR